MAQQYTWFEQAVGTVVIGVIAIVAIIFFLHTELVLITAAVATAALWYFKGPLGRERNRRQEQKELYREAQQVVAHSSFPSSEDFVKQGMCALEEQSRLPHPTLYETFRSIATQLYEQEQFTAISPPPSKADSLEGARWRDNTRALITKLRRPDAVREFGSVLFSSFKTFMDTLPPHALAGSESEQINTPFGLSLVDSLLSPARSVEQVRWPFYSTEAKGYFTVLKAQLDRNLEEAGGVSVNAYRGEDVAKSFLKETPLFDLFKIELPFDIPQHLRFEGHWIVAPPGRGKTNLLSAMFVEDMRRDAAIIVLDSKGDLLDPIRRIKEVAHRLVILEPDPKFPLALNPLDIGTDIDDPLKVNRAVSLLEHLFGSLFEAKMTSLQARFFRIVLRAIITAAERPTLDTFRTLCQTGAADGIDLARLSEADRMFFEKEFATKTYAETRNQVLWRLGLLLDNPVFAAMFSAKKTQVDIGSLMDSGAIVLINNSKALLDDDGAEFFGRFFIALVRMAAQRRALLDERDKLPVFFYMDECQSVIRRDENIATIIDECRSQKIALIMAHQRVAQITSPNVLNALSNCALRFANSDDDARQLAPGWRTEPEFLRKRRGHFAAFVRDLTDTAVDLHVSRTDLKALPKTSQAEYEQLLASVRRLYCVPPQRPDNPPSEPNQPRRAPQSDEPIVTLHHPDLPWKLEPKPPTEEFPTEPSTNY